MGSTRRETSVGGYTPLNALALITIQVAGDGDDGILICGQLQDGASCDSDVG